MMTAKSLPPGEVARYRAGEGEQSKFIDPAALARPLPRPNSPEGRGCLLLSDLLVLTVLWSFSSFKNLKKS